MSDVEYYAAVTGNLSIAFNPALTNLDGLSNLNSLGGGLSITYNDALCQDSVDALLARCIVSGAVRTENNDGGCP